MPWAMLVSIPVPTPNELPIWRSTPLTAWAPNAGVAATIAPVQSFVDGLGQTIVGFTSKTIVGGGSSDLIRSGERPGGNLVADAFLDKARELTGEGINPFVGIVNGGGIRADLAAGDISLEDTFSISPFGNFVSVVEDVSTADLVLLLENAYSRTIDGPEPGLDPVRQGDGTGRFAQLSGINVVYDLLAQPMVLDMEGNIVTPGERILSVTLRRWHDHCRERPDRPRYRLRHRHGVVLSKRG